MFRGGSPAAGNASFTGGTQKGVALDTTNTGLATLLAQSYVQVSTPADTTEDTLVTVTVPANALGANGALRIYTIWGATSNANVKTVRVRYSGGAGTVFHSASLASQAQYVALLVISNRNATNSQISHGITSSSFGLNGNAVITAAIDTTASTTIVFTGQKATAGDSLTLEGYTVEIVH